MRARKENVEDDLDDSPADSGAGRGPGPRAMSLMIKKTPSILYLLSVHSHGEGGHYYDAVTVARALAESSECVIATIGAGRSPIVDSSGLASEHVQFAGPEFFAATRRLRAIVERHDIGVVHSFDNQAFAFARMAAFSLRLKHVHTKAGGPDPTGWFPTAETLVVESGENYDHFTHTRPWSETDVRLIPNRVSPIEQDAKRIDRFRREHGLTGGEDRIFLRIGRFTDGYRRGFMQSIRMVDDLNAIGLPSRLIILGTVDDRPVYDEVVRAAGGNTIVSRDPAYTFEAARLIDVSDCVVGTGRGLMEAASLGKILFTELSNAPYPIRVVENNFDRLFYTNFSPRNSLGESVPGPAYLEDVAAFLRSQRRGERDRFALDVFARHFDVADAVEQYRRLYNEAPAPGGRARAAADVLRCLFYGVRKTWRGRRQRESSGRPVHHS